MSMPNPGAVIGEYLKAYKAANDTALPPIQIGYSGGWYQIKHFSMSGWTNYRRKDIEQMTERLKQRAADANKRRTP